MAANNRETTDETTIQRDMRAEFGKEVDVIANPDGSYMARMYGLGMDELDMLRDMVDVQSIGTHANNYGCSCCSGIAKLEVRFELDE